MKKGPVFFTQSVHVEWSGYQMVKKYEDIGLFIRFDKIHERGKHPETDGQTDRHRTTAENPLMHSLASRAAKSNAGSVSKMLNGWLKPAVNTTRQSAVDLLLNLCTLVARHVNKNLFHDP